VYLKIQSNSEFRFMFSIKLEIELNYDFLIKIIEIQPSISHVLQIIHSD
jgi:hypothetical protein